MAEDPDDDTVRSLRGPEVEDDTVRSLRHPEPEDDTVRSSRASADDTVRSGRRTDEATAISSRRRSAEIDDTVPAVRRPPAGTAAPAPGAPHRTATSGRPEKAIYRPRPPEPAPVRPRAAPRPPGALLDTGALEQIHDRDRRRWALVAMIGGIAIAVVAAAALIVLLVATH